MEKTERAGMQVKMDVLLQPKQETVRDVADWLEASEKGGGETGMAQVREYILDFWKCAGE